LTGIAQTLEAITNQVIPVLIAAKLEYAKLK